MLALLGSSENYLSTVKTDPETESIEKGEASGTVRNASEMSWRIEEPALYGRRGACDDDIKSFSAHQSRSCLEASEAVRQV